MADLTIEKINEVYIKIDCEPGIEREISDRFTFDAPGAKFMPQYRKKYWDGKIRLYNLQNKRLYVGLLDKLIALQKIIIIPISL